jgi:hypothetical protein
MKTFRRFHFCGCVTVYGSPFSPPGEVNPDRREGRWRLVGFHQNCNHRWRAGHFGLTREQEAAAESEEANEGQQ